MSTWMSCYVTCLHYRCVQVCGWLRMSTWVSCCVTCLHYRCVQVCWWPRMSTWVSCCVTCLHYRCVDGWEWAHEWAVVSPVCTTGVYRCVGGWEWVHEWVHLFALQVCTGVWMAENEYTNELLCHLFALQRRQVLCDVTLITDDGKLSAHSAVLAAASQFMCEQFQQLTRTEWVNRSMHCRSFTVIKQMDVYYLEYLPMHWSK